LINKSTEDQIKQYLMIRVLSVGYLDNYTQVYWKFKTILHLYKAG